MKSFDNRFDYQVFEFLYRWMCSLKVVKLGIRPRPFRTFKELTEYSNETYEMGVKSKLIKKAVEK